MNDPLKTPVAFMIFNRPEVTARVFEAIRARRPQQLLVVADGPRADRVNEAERCAAARACIDRVDWPCEIMKNYAETNLGCGTRVVSGLDWVFSNVQEAIILEDDCLPNPSFFPFCEAVLDKYRDDQRIMHIGGTNLQCGISRTQWSYYFSKHPMIWGWATWRRAWKLNDFHCSTWPTFKAAGLFKTICPNPREYEFWTKILDRMETEKLHNWDTQWRYSIWSNGGVAITPNVNLVSNIGFGKEATHTTETSAHLRWANLPSYGLSSIKHPPFVVRNTDADEHTAGEFFSCPAEACTKPSRSVPRRALSRLKRMIVSLAWRGSSARPPHSRAQLSSAKAEVK